MAEEPPVVQADAYALPEAQAVAVDNVLQSELLESIRNTSTMVLILQIYDSANFQMSLQRIRNRINGSNERATEWAIEMRNHTPEVESLNMDRKIVLELLYQLCNQWKKHPENTTVTEETIVSEFQGHRVQNILSCGALAMDRAQCLSKMQYPGATTYGMHWVSEQHVAADAAWQQRMEGGKRPTMNKRFLWLLELEGLELQRVPQIVQLLQPVEVETE